MRKALIFSTFITMILFWSAGAFAEDWTAELYKNYISALCQHFEVSEQVVTSLADQGIAVEELPVAFLMAKRGEVKPDPIVGDRVKGASWMSIAEDHGLDAGIFYIMINAKFSSKIYSPIMEKYNPETGKLKKDLSLDDGEIMNLANLRFLSSVHDYSMFEIMAMRDYGKNFVRINQQVKEAKAALMAKEKEERKKAKEAAKKTE